MLYRGQYLHFLQLKIYNVQIWTKTFAVHCILDKRHWSQYLVDLNLFLTYFDIICFKALNTKIGSTILLSHAQYSNRKTF